MEYPMHFTKLTFDKNAVFTICELWITPYGNNIKHHWFKISDPKHQQAGNHTESLMYSNYFSYLQQQKFHIFSTF